ncbi:2-oxoacid dehydrogenases acyltransferase-domain-containing protein [Pseudoneurospora amorphoporcata]|uniref:Dihydrolipoamide acetyltransferase component of pyruvate dehydrogenase complex n=1 Tax=Pseudoneurospora amorphoporcata TaxID=241081 RepID=A0AAN6SKA5_9PEZI|nr:2-oxoacid dehydrogenases acyltransferase-domain-containing protein [Pseudoneurospora amorphoporcata]
MKNMLLRQSSRAVGRQELWRLRRRGLSRLAPTATATTTPSTTLSHTHPLPANLRSSALAQQSSTRRQFHATRELQLVKPVLLADIGEGIVECEVIQWFVEPGARVEEFSRLCEVQSDKASVEITSRFAGVVKKLYYDAGEMAKVGKPFVDIDIEGGPENKEVEALTPPEPVSTPEGQQASKGEAISTSTPQAIAPELEQAFIEAPWAQETPALSHSPVTKQTGKHASLATPAVRHLAKGLNVDITEIPGTGKDGRVLKEDVYKFVQARDSASTPSPSAATPTLPGVSAAAAAASAFSSPDATISGPQTEITVPLTRTQEMMFKSMTRSLTIPHFLYADEVDFTSLVELRARLNKVLSKSGLPEGQVKKLSYLPFVIKAVSMALYKYPVLNARVDLVSNTNGKPSLVMRSQHNIGVAMDTPSGLLVPVVKNVGSLNILSIAAELARLQSLAVAGKLSPQDMSGGTITVSNIGSIGGTYLSPVIVEKEVAILGIGRMRTVPAFSTVPGEEDKILRRQICNFSWSADHRVIDGATMARAADVVRTIVEEPDVMVMHLR